MTRNDFLKSIDSSSLFGAYILHGSEEYLKALAIRKAKDSVDEAARDLNIDIFDSAQSESIISACETLPFFSERRVVICNCIPKDEDAKNIKNYLPSIAQSTLLLFISQNEADEKLAFFKYLAEQDRTVNFNPLSEQEAVLWIIKQAKSRNVTITNEAAKLLVSLVGIECSTLKNEFEKVACYVGDGNEITKEAINKTAIRDIEYVVFSILDSFIAGKANDGFKSLSGVLKDGEDPMHVAMVLGGKAKLTLEARRLMDMGIKKEAIIKKLPCSSGYAYRICSSASALKRKQIPLLTQAALALNNIPIDQVLGKSKASDALERALLMLIEN